MAMRKLLVHRQCGGIDFGAADNLSGYAGDGAVRWDVIEDDAASSDFCTGTDFDISQNLSPGSDEDAVPYFGVPVT